MWRRQQDEVRATREGEGDQREGNGQQLRKKTEKKVHQAAAASCHVFMSGKGRRCEKKRDNPLMVCQ